MNINVITRQIGIGMLAFCATFVQTTMFASSHFGGANTPAVHVSDGRVAAGNTMVTKDATSRRG